MGTRWRSASSRSPAGVRGERIPPRMPGWRVLSLPPNQLPMPVSSSAGRARTPSAARRRRVPSVATSSTVKAARLRAKGARPRGSETLKSARRTRTRPSGSVGTDSLPCGEESGAIRVSRESGTSVDADVYRDGRKVELRDDERHHDRGGPSQLRGEALARRYPGAGDASRSSRGHLVQPIPEGGPGQRILGRDAEVEGGEELVAPMGPLTVLNVIGVRRDHLRYHRRGPESGRDGGGAEDVDQRQREGDAQR